MAVSTRDLAAVGAFALLACAPGPVPAETRPIGLELLLAIDISASVDVSEFALQKAGITEAFRDPEVLRAVMDQGGIAVAVMLWSGKSCPRPLVVPWSMISDQGAVDGFIAAVEALSIPGGLRCSTAIGEAVAQGVAYLEGNGIAAFRSVIDVAADGKNNDGMRMTAARDLAFASGVTINGLAVLDDEPDLEAYFRRDVITPGGFVQTAGSYADFIEAMRAKLVLEIAGLLPEGGDHG